MQVAPSVHLNVMVLSDSAVGLLVESSVQVYWSTLTPYKGTTSIPKSLLELDSG